MAPAFRAVCLFSSCFVVVLAACSAKDTEPSSEEQTRAIIKKALDFQKGDVVSLTDAQNDFTPAAWDKFAAKFDGWLDDGGAPQFSSELTDLTFVSSALSGDGKTRTVYGGVLTYAQGASHTAYRVKITAEFSDDPVMITALDYSTCGGANAVSSCR